MTNSSSYFKKQLGIFRCEDSLNVNVLKNTYVFINKEKYYTYTILNIIL